MIPILTISGSDNTGFTGLQQDLRIITEMGGHAMTSATCQVTQYENAIKKIEFYREERVREQVASVVADYHPKAVKVGLVGNPASVKAVAEEIVGCRRIVVAPGIVFSNGMRYVRSAAVEAIKCHLVPLASLLIMRCKDAEVMLNMKINTDDDMKNAANAFLDMGAEYVMLRGGNIANGRVTALLAGPLPEEKGEGREWTFFSSYFVEGWQQHGVGGALSAAITTRLGMGDDVRTAVRNAHEYVHSRVVYAVRQEEQPLRPVDIYNAFMDLIADNYTEIHDVYSYAEKLNVSTRYLAMITTQTTSKSPKQVIADYLMEKARQMLKNSRLSVKEIAMALGFSTNPVFCKFFKQQEGKTPSEFRNLVESLS